jgi:tetratricopeptide (TPR) repeat protein
MAKKAKPTQKKKVHSTSTPVSQTERWMAKIQTQLLQQDYQGVIEDGERLLTYLPAHAPERLHVLIFLGAAYTSLDEFVRAYDVYTQAVQLAPNDSDVWYNRGLASRYNSRFALSLRDLERAAEVDTGILEKEIQKETKLAQKFVKEALKLRGRNFTFEQLLEQETLYHQALA